VWKPAGTEEPIVVLGALILRVVFALIVTQLLEVVGLVFAGGLLLLWVAWWMWREGMMPVSRLVYPP
jgi:predicted tellurium resistance membrane protein TerC